MSRPTIVTCLSCGKKNRVWAEASGVPHCGHCGRALPWLVESDVGSFEAVATKSPLPVLVEFWAPWCGPCRMVAPAVERLSRELAGRLKVVKVNTDAEPELGRRFNVLGIPTLLLLEGGQPRDRVTGALTAERLKEWLEPKLASRQSPQDRS
jgi:thioredoxin 2